MLQVNNLKKYFPIRRGFFRKVVGYVKAVDDVSFFVNEGETLGLVGESGCGKTTTGRCILRAVDPTSGEIWFTDPNLGKVDISQLEEDQLPQIRRNIRMIFQDLCLVDPHDPVGDRWYLPGQWGRLCKELEDQAKCHPGRSGPTCGATCMPQRARQRSGWHAPAPYPKFVCDEPVSH
jgi:ABC-type antimicrobial peptide transport system ATPase subunit